MCNNYMDGCRVKIVSQGDNWRDEKLTEGKFYFDGERAELEYVLDGDNCVLTYDKTTVTQTREGRNNLYLAFRKDEKTQCTLTAGGMCGSFEIFTQEINFSADEKGFKLILKYYSGDDREKINLTLTAEKIGG